MTEPKFTPGPWHAHEGVHEPDYVYCGAEERCDEEHRVICEVYSRPKGHFCCPDANLISAAPEMYEALTIVCEECPRHHELDSCEWACTIGQALRKARGESEVSDD